MARLVVDVPGLTAHDLQALYRAVGRDQWSSAVIEFLDYLGDEPVRQVRGIESIEVCGDHPSDRQLETVAVSDLRL